MCPYLCKTLSVVMYRKFRNVPIFKDFPPICPYFLGFRVGKYALIHVMIVPAKAAKSNNTMSFYYSYISESALRITVQFAIFA